jgi:chemotaxis protein methyltransferase CheR
MNNVTATEIASLLETLHQEYGYDFRQYCDVHIKRRILNRLSSLKLKSISELQDKVLHDKVVASEVLRDLSITVTRMFRDPDFYISLRKNVVPILKTYPFIKVWHAGCATGEEVYSLAILLREENLYDRTTIYATDYNQQALNEGREGIFSIKKIQKYTINYQLAAGQEPFSNYYMANYENAIIDHSLKKNIVWAHHNLVTDSVFAEVHLILCRNVMIYFNEDLQNHVQNLLFESLIRGGVLCLGSKESLRFCSIADEYQELDKKQRIFKKKY